MIRGAWVFNPQFIGPTLQFLIGWKIYDEPMTSARLFSFALIWLAVGIDAADALRRSGTPDFER